MEVFVFMKMTIQPTKPSGTVLYPIISTLTERLNNDKTKSNNNFNINIINKDIGVYILVQR